MKSCRKEGKDESVEKEKKKNHLRWWIITFLSIFCYKLFTYILFSSIVTIVLWSCYYYRPFTKNKAEPEEIQMIGTRLSV